jgi:hypothetical protein
MNDELREKMCKELTEAGWKSYQGRWFLESFPPVANTLPLDMAYERMKAETSPKS